MPAFEPLDPDTLRAQGLADGAYFMDLAAVEETICTPPCECADCQLGFYAPWEQMKPSFSYRGRISDRDAREIAARHVRDAQQDRQYLLQRLASHADPIVNRWKKKSREKRQALLIETIPELYEHRWLIPRYCYLPEAQNLGLRGRTVVRRRQLLLHWLSVEVLTMNPAVLFALLHNRATYPPQDWAPFDGKQLTLSWAAGHFDVEFSGKCVIMYGPRYGELVDWQAGPAHRADIIGFPKARLILEAQSYLMGVLRKIVDKILEGVDLSKPASSDKWKLMTKLGFKHTNEVELWSPYTNQAFSAPPVFSIDNLISIAQTRLDAIGDHLELLQTEPTYMRRYIRIICQGEFYKAIKRDVAGAVVATEMFRDVSTYWRWTWIKKECEHVKSIHDRVRDSICSGKSLPPVYDRALGSLELLIVNEVIGRANDVGTLMRQRPGFSRDWKCSWCPDDVDGPTVFKIERKAGAPKEQKDLFARDPLDWCLTQMQGQPDKQTHYDHAILFSFLESHLACSDSKERARLDEFIYQKLSDLAACHEILVSVRLHRPQNKARDIEEVKVSEKGIAWKGLMIETFLRNETVGLGTALLKDFFEAPLPSGQKNSVWLTRTQNIRKALEGFWTDVRKSCKKALENSKFTAEEVRTTLEVVSINLTQNYIDSVQAEQQRILDAIKNASVPAAVQVQKEWLSDASTQPAAPLRKTKVKTRHSKHAGSVEEIDRAVSELMIDSNQDKPPTTDKSPQIQVTKRAYDVLTVMYSTTAEESAKTIKWDMFVHSMLDMGFSARNGGGSAVVFENGTLAEGKAVGGRIIFHKPHPIPNIDPIILHIMGKRMTKWFGWHRELFVLP